MSDRPYTVREIDELRQACEMLWLFGPSAFTPRGSGSSRSYRDADKDKGVEELVRTYMMAGITGSDIRKEYEK